MAIRVAVFTETDRVVTGNYETERNGREMHEWLLHEGSQMDRNGMNDMEVKLRVKNSHSQEQPQYSRSAYGAWISIFTSK